MVKHENRLNIDIEQLLPFIDFSNHQKALPAIAKNPAACDIIQQTVAFLPSTHRLILNDSRDLVEIPDESIHLIVTSPPYWTLKKYNEIEGQLGHIKEYEDFIAQLDKVWKECLRVLVPGGRLIIVVGDICLSRRQHGSHKVVPLHSSIQEHCRIIGFDNLAPIIWHKIANAKYEAPRSSSFLGKPYEPNAVIKNDIEYILMQRKPNGYRNPSLESRVLSIISENDHRRWFQQIWTDVPGASTCDHPAPFPIELANRLIRMFSFVGDTVLDPFAGTGTITIAASKIGRNSIGIEVDPTYLQYAANRITKEKIAVTCEPDIFQYQTSLSLVENY